ncbi:MAG: hypothetical protein IPP47_32875 [Bryobacterales bacterium]|nr:hypothetical protein [Bryobacterales bacterium]
MFDDDENDDMTVTPKPQTQSALPWWTAAIGAGVFILGGLTYFQSAEVQSLRQDVTQLGLNQAKENAALRAIFAKSDQELQGVLREFRTELASTRQQTTEGMNKAQVAAARRAELIASQIEVRQKERSQQFTEELAKVRESHDDASNKINSITTEVGAVKTELETTRSNIQETRNDLQRVRGDMGMMSGLVATNSKEIQILRELGDRDIFEFTLMKSAGLQQVGDVRLLLKKADTGRNRYTLELLSDDKRVEKKDKSLNEPVQFYTSSRASKQPYELVVNEVRKNAIVGYLARPKLVLAQSRAK